jgi:endogenous inhibitor of DNA gyrase (YacG/DUF329 family)
MPRKRALKLRCPSCKQAVTSASPEFPFCSRRCRLVDLGKWASGEYVISSPIRDTSDSAPENKPENLDED